MATADNLYSMTQSFLTPDLIQRISASLGQPAEKVQSGLKSVIPAFLMGLANKGSSSEGAQSIINMTKNPNLQGPEAVNGIFGNELTTVATSLGASTDMSSTSITKLFAMVAPMVMSVIGKKVNQEGLNASGLKGFLTQQKSSLAQIVPTGISNLLGFGSSSPGFGKVASQMKDIPHSAKPFPTTAETTLPARTKSSWAPLVLLALAILGGLWWFTRGSHEMSAPNANKTQSRVETPVNTTLTTPAADLAGLGAFFRAQNSNELPKRFSFQNLNFATGTSALAQNSVAELDFIAATMKTHPRATARIEGFTDNTGDASMNQSLSASRADAVKQELVSRGIEASRLETQGRGMEAPIANNSTDSGRADNRRIEFVVTGF